MKLKIHNAYRDNMQKLTGGMFLTTSSLIYMLACSRLSDRVSDGERANPGGRGALVSPLFFSLALFFVRPDYLRAWKRLFTCKLYSATNVVKARCLDKTLLYD